MAAEVERLGERAWYLRGPVNQGVVVDGAGKGCLLIDSGLDRSSANRILRLLGDRGWRVEAVVNTHAHADHFGGNRTIVEKAGARVYCPAVEAAVLRDPIWEPFYLCGGASPPAELRVKFFLADPSPVDGTIRPGEPLPGDLADWGVDIVDLAGHSLGMVGVGTDGMLFCGDAFFDAEVVEKHGLPYAVDVTRTLAVLRRLEGLAADDYAFLIASHGRAYRVPEESRPQVRFNIARVDEITARVAAFLAVARTPDEVLSDLCAAFGVVIPSMGLYYLYRATVAAYLTYLQGEGVARAYLDGPRLLWEAT